jgi:hypothetical protein
MMGTKRSVVGTFFGVNLASLVLTTAIPAFAQDNSTATTGQQGATGQQGQQPHSHSHHHHAHSGTNSGTQQNQQ